LECLDADVLDQDGERWSLSRYILKKNLIGELQGIENNQERLQLGE
jgi:hypothetical protein